MHLNEDNIELNTSANGHCVCAFQGECVGAEAVTNSQWSHRSLIVCLHNKSNVSREIIYTRTVLNKWIIHLLNSRIFFVPFLAQHFVCYLLALQNDSMTTRVCLFLQEEARISSQFHHCHWCIWCYLKTNEYKSVIGTLRCVQGEDLHPESLSRLQEQWLAPWLVLVIVPAVAKWPLKSCLKLVFAQV